jgi:hypothetical protein
MLVPPCHAMHRVQVGPGTCFDGIQPREMAQPTHDQPVTAMAYSWCTWVPPTPRRRHRRKKKLSIPIRQGRERNSRATTLLRCTLERPLGDSKAADARRYRDRLAPPIGSLKPRDLFHSPRHRIMTPHSSRSGITVGAVRSRCRPGAGYPRVWRILPHARTRLSVLEIRARDGGA